MIKLRSQLSIKAGWCRYWHGVGGWGERWPEYGSIGMPNSLAEFFEKFPLPTSASSVSRLEA